MKKVLIIVSSLFLFVVSSCQQGKKTTSAPKAVVAEVNVEEKTIPEILNGDGHLVGKSVSIKGEVTHVCHHTGLRLFMKEKGGKNILRVESTPKLGKFPLDLEQKEVHVIGIVQEKRIDEAYLKGWEQRIKKNSEQTSECNTEKAAQHIKGKTVEDQIAHYRDEIAQRKQKENKDYISFFFIKAERISR